MTSSALADNPFMTALAKLEATEANLLKLERIWEELSSMTPAGLDFSPSIEYEDRTRSFELILGHLPKIDGWKPSSTPPDLRGVAQSRFDAMELDEPSAIDAVEHWIEEPGRELREYRFRLNDKRRALVRDQLIKLIDAIDADIRQVSAAAADIDISHDKIRTDAWETMRQHMKEIETLLGSSIAKPPMWAVMLRHIRFGEVSDLRQIETTDWPEIKAALRKGLYGINEPIPVDVEDLATLVASHPTGPITTALAWAQIDDETFERLIFTLISDTPGYENPEWLMQTRAADKGRDLSVTRITQDGLAGTQRMRNIIQCKHWLSRSISLSDVTTTKDQMALWPHPRVDILTFATSGRFTADAISWIEQHNTSGIAPKIEMWADSHLELILASRPAVIAEFKLRGGR